MPAAPVLAPLDLIGALNPALSVAADLAKRSGASLHLLSVRMSPSSDPAPNDPDAGYRAQIEATVDRTLGPGASAALSPTIHVVHGSDPATATLDLARQLDPQVIVLGTHGRRGYQRFMQGSVAEKVIRGAHCPTLAVPMNAARWLPGPDHPVVVATDLSDCGAAVLRAGAKYAERYGAQVVVVHCVAPIPRYVGVFAHWELYESETDLPPGTLEAVRDQMEVSAVKGADLVVRRAETPELIDRVARTREAGCIVMGTHGRSGVARAVLGSVTTAVLRGAPCSVLAVHVDSGSNVGNVGKAGSVGERAPAG
jgi:nucleotide-binding universal stress UspA family protein